VKFIYFGISYDNPCSPLSLSLLPAPRSPLQAHVLATSEVFPTIATVVGIQSTTLSFAWAMVDQAYMVGVDGLYHDREGVRYRHLEVEGLLWLSTEFNDHSRVYMILLPTYRMEVLRQCMSCHSSENTND
jgi:hypothetical protein